jgi:hypothetical protein
MAVRMAGSTARLEGVQSILDVADYIDLLVLSVDQSGASFQRSGVLAGSPNVCSSNQKPTLCKNSEQS